VLGGVLGPVTDRVVVPGLGQRSSGPVRSSVLVTVAADVAGDAAMAAPGVVAHGVRPLGPGLAGRGTGCGSGCSFSPPLAAGPAPAGRQVPSPVGSTGAAGPASSPGASAASGIFAVLAAGVLALLLARGGVVRERVDRLAGLIHAPVCLPG
jgi:hypothetical protein